MPTQYLKVHPTATRIYRHIHALSCHPDYPNDSVFGIHMPAFPLYPDGLNQYPFPVTAESLRYHNGFMRTQIGRRITVDFLMGANTIVQKTGYLLGVAQDYILLNEIDTNDITTCDYYNIKFIRYYY